MYKRQAEDLAGRLTRAARLGSDRPAVVCGATTLTYRALDARATALAGALRRAGVGVESRVALVLDRSAEWVTAMLGVLKAGGAYAPIDTSWPAARVRQVLGDLRPASIVTTRSGGVELPPDGPPVVFLEDVDLRVEPDLDRPCAEVPGGAAAYVLYTSGSTGSPKGVVVSRANLAHYVDGIIARLGLTDTPADCQLQFAHVSTFAADLGHTCLFPALVTGNCLHVLEDAVARDSAPFADYLRAHRIDAVSYTHLTLPTIYSV